MEDKVLFQLNQLFRNKELSFGNDIQSLEFDTDMQTYIVYSNVCLQMCIVMQCIHKFTHAYL